MQKVTISNNKISKFMRVISSVTLLLTLAILVIALGRVDAELMTTKELFGWLLLISATGTVSIKSEMVSQRNTVTVDFAEYIKSDRNVNHYDNITIEDCYKYCAIGHVICIENGHVVAIKKASDLAESNEPLTK